MKPLSAAWTWKATATSRSGWSHVNASVLKVKLATAIIGISSIHLLKTFINADNYTDRVLIAQTVIHITFLLSALAIAATDRMMSSNQNPH